MECIMLSLFHALVFLFFFSVLLVLSDGIFLPFFLSVPAPN